MPCCFKGECHRVDTWEQGFPKAGHIYPAGVTSGDRAAAWCLVTSPIGRPITF